MTLPPLPEPAILLTVDLPMLKGGAVKKQPFFTADQMLEFAQAAVLAERAECAKLCEGGALYVSIYAMQDDRNAYGRALGNQITEAESHMAKKCAAAIRARGE